MIISRFLLYISPITQIAVDAVSVWSDLVTENHSFWILWCSKILIHFVYMRIMFIFSVEITLLSDKKNLILNQ